MHFARTFVAVILPIAVDASPSQAEGKPGDPGLVLTRWRSVQSEANTRITFNSRFGAYYQLQRSTNLRGWTNIGPGVLGNNDMVSINDTGSEGSAFYRLQWSDPCPSIPPFHHFVAIGDSITDASSYRDSYGTLQPASHGWATPLAALLAQRLRPLPITNARKKAELDNGYSGIQAAQFKLTGKDGVNPFNSAVALNTPNTVFIIHIGTNDIWDGDSAEVTAAR